MSCSSSSHAQHTFVRGCCSTLCPCPGVASYSAEPYCPCNETIGNKFGKEKDLVCTILKALDGQSIPQNNVQNSFEDLNWLQIRCGTYDIVTVTGPSEEYLKIGTVENGTYTPISITFVPTLYPIYINTVETGTQCATITITL